MTPDNAEQLLKQLQPFTRDEDAYGKLHADLHDMIEICEWFLQTMDSVRQKQLSRDEIESLLIELEVNLVDRGGFHLKSLKKGIAEALRQISEKEDREDDISGAA